MQRLQVEHYNVPLSTQTLVYRLDENVVTSNTSIQFHRKATADTNGFEDPVLPITHCARTVRALRVSAANLLMLKNPAGLLRLYRPYQSLSVAHSHLFKYLIYQATLKTYFNIHLIPKWRAI